jgi:hypothetical protein
MWRLVGNVTLDPDTESVTVGNVEVPTTGGLPVRVMTTTNYPFKWGYCLLSYQSPYGRELGTIKVWPRAELTQYLLGDGFSVNGTVGQLVFEPRTWNLRWIKAGFAVTVAVFADVPSEVSTETYTPTGWLNGLGQSLELVLSGSLGRLQF